MVAASGILSRVRAQLGDTSTPFQNSIVADGVTNTFDIPAGIIDTNSLSVLVITQGVGPVTLTSPADYQLNGDTIVLTTPPPEGSTLLVSGNSYSLFSDDELSIYVNDALGQHLYARKQEYRYRDTDGFIRYSDLEAQATDIPEVEEYPIALLATIFALWAIATDSATDVDIVTGEGTVINQHQRFEQVTRQIASLQQQYQEICAQLNVGLNRIEMFDLRRISKTTNRYVPIFIGREYDDSRYPIRKLPPVDRRDEDESGIPSPIYTQGVW